MAISTGTALALGGVSLLSGVLGGLFQSKSQKSANETNLQATRETNQLNKQMFDQSIAYQNEMFDKTNAYNAPANQVKLLQQAGINPAAVYGNGSTANAFMPSSPSAPSMVAGHVDPVDYSWIPNSIDMGVNAYFNNQVLSNDVVKGRYDSQIAKVNAEKELRNLEYNCMKVMNDAKSSEYAKEQAKVTLYILKKTERDSITQAQWSTKIMEQEYKKAIQSIQESRLRQDAQRIANQYAPKMSEAQLKQYHANVAACYAAARASDASAADSYAHEAVNNVAAAAGRLDNNQKKILFSDIRTKAQEEAKQAKETTTKMQSVNRYGEFRYHYSGSSKYDYETPRSVENSVKAYYAGKRSSGRRK